MEQDTEGDFTQKVIPCPDLSHFSDLKLID